MCGASLKPAVAGRGPGGCFFCRTNSGSRQQIRHKVLRVIICICAIMFLVVHNDYCNHSYRRIFNTLWLYNLSIYRFAQFIAYIDRVRVRLVNLRGRSHLLILHARYSHNASKNSQPISATLMSGQIPFECPAMHQLAFPAS